MGTGVFVGIGVAGGEGDVRGGVGTGVVVGAGGGGEVGVVGEAGALSAADENSVRAEAYLAQGSF